jgi:hypothetical protein
MEAHTVAALVQARPAIPRGRKGDNPVRELYVLFTPATHVLSHQQMQDN